MPTAPARRDEAAGADAPSAAEAMRLFVDAKADAFLAFLAFLAFPPQPQELSRCGCTRSA